VFATAILGGLRKGELCGLQKPDVDLARRLLLVRRCYARPFPKNRKQRVVRMPELRAHVGAEARHPSAAVTMGRWIEPSVGTR
jgi:integrase